MDNYKDAMNMEKRLLWKGNFNKKKNVINLSSKVANNFIFKTNVEGSNVLYCTFIKENISGID
jgi:hypothetical protein